MKTTICICIAFIVGAIAGGRFTMRACERAIYNSDLSAIAERSVRNMAAAYENQFNKSQVFEKFEAKFNACVSEISGLRKRIYYLENPPKSDCFKNGLCEIK